MKTQHEIAVCIREAADDIEALVDEPELAERLIAWSKAVSAKLALEDFISDVGVLKALGADPDEVIAVADVMLRQYTGRDGDTEGAWPKRREVLLAGLRGTPRLGSIEEHVRSAMDAHRQEGGSFRFLIYDRMGLPSGAYVPLYLAGGMDFSNACPEGQPIGGVV